MVRRKRRWLPFWLGAAGVGIAVLVFVRARTVKRPPLATPPACPLGRTTSGIDVSYHQGDITWPRVRRAGVKFAFIRVSDGTDVIDPKFEANWSGAKAAGITRGAYQFFRPAESVNEQADILIRALRKHGAGELAPVIDIEETGGLPLSAVVANAQAWIARVKRELGVDPIVYTNPGMWRGRGLPELAAQPLWLAHYTDTCPELPSPWSEWRVWQYTETGRVPGIDGPVDLDVMR